MKHLYVTLTFLVVIFSINAQDYSVSNINDSLRSNCYAILRVNNMDVKINSTSSASFKVSRAITILDKEHEEYAYIRINLSKNSSLSEFSGCTYNAEGKVVTKLKKSDLSRSEYTNESLADDAYFYHLMPKISSFPCTIEFSYEVEIKDMLASFPTFIPLPFDAGVSLENASYSLCVPKGYTFKTKKINTNIEPIKSNEKDNDVYFWHTKNIKAYENNIFMPDYKEFLPIVYISPIGFTYKKNYVNMLEWADYGEWIYSLFEGRDILPLDLKEKVHALTDTLKNDRDKVKALYEYMCSTCRYVSVQLGIGGLQPMKAIDVYNNKFGDCKALSFYLHSMLKECGITSHYVILGTENINLYEDIVVPMMTDHVILQVPLQGETLWIECTNSENPFAYIPKSIAGHSCIVVKKGESKLSRLPKYADSLNIDYQKINIDLEANGGAKGEIIRKCMMGEHQSKMGFKHLKNNEQKEFFSRYISIPQLIIDTVSYEFIYNTHPEVDLKCRFSTPKFSSSAGIRNFIPINQFREHSPYVKATRDYDISIKYGYCDIDSIEIRLPQNIIVEALPKDINFKSIFGQIESKTTQKDNTIIISQKLLLNSGTFSKSKTSELSKFMNQLKAAYNATIVTKKVSQ